MKMTTPPCRRRTPPPQPSGLAVTLPGLPGSFTVISQADAEALAYVLCVDAEGPVYFADDVCTTCACCDRPIRHRPHVPRQPTKLCLACASSLNQEAA
jgi:hypothetical protein